MSDLLRTNSALLFVPGAASVTITSEDGTVDVQNPSENVYDLSVDSVKTIAQNAATTAGEAKTTANYAIAGVNGITPLIPSDASATNQLATHDDLNGFIGEVKHDSTLSGKGTEADPLKVVGGGSGGLNVVNHDSTLVGDGTVDNPLGINPVNYNGLLQTMNIYNADETCSFNPESWGYPGYFSAITPTVDMLNSNLSAEFFIVTPHTPYDGVVVGLWKKRDGDDYIDLVAYSDYRNTSTYFENKYGLVKVPLISYTDGGQSSIYSNSIYYFGLLVKGFNNLDVLTKNSGYIINSGTFPMVWKHSNCGNWSDIDGCVNSIKSLQLIRNGYSYAPFATITRG